MLPHGSVNINTAASLPVDSDLFRWTMWYSGDTTASSSTGVPRLGSMAAAFLCR